MANCECYNQMVMVGFDQQELAQIGISDSTYINLFADFNPPVDDYL